MRKFIRLNLSVRGDDDEVYDRRYVEQQAERKSDEIDFN